MAGFWSAVAFAEVELEPPFTPGVVKGLLLRNLRWWSTQKDILTPQGTLSIGYCYPNQFMSENYNSPGSTYWFMLGFVALALPESHEFWRSEEQPYPVDKIPQILALDQPKHIMVNKGGHSFLLSSGQRCHYPMRASEAKYGKFAYSTAFGYSVPTGGYFVEAIGADNTLALSDDEGETWKVRRVTLDAKLETRDNIPVLISDWKPWNAVSVKTYLIPPTDDTPSWHVRAHRVTTKRTLISNEGAFGMHGVQEDDGRELRVLANGEKEGQLEAAGEAVAVSSAGVVGIVELWKKDMRQGKVLQEDANSNLVSSRSVLPSLAADLQSATDAWLVTAVFAIPSTAPGWESWREAWNNRPRLPSWLEELIS